MREMTDAERAHIEHHNSSTRKHMNYPFHVRRMLLVEIEKARQWCEADDATSPEYRQGYLSGMQNALIAVDDMNKRILALLDLAFGTDVAAD